MRENQYQRKVRKRVESEFPGCHIMKNDPNLQQGILDLTILFGDKWACLEVKRSANEPFQPNQEYYLNKFSDMSFASVIYPEIEDEVFEGLERTFRPSGETFIP